MSLNGHSCLDSVLAYKKQHQVGRFAPPPDAPPPVAHVDIPIGARCEVESAEEGLHKRGTVRFVGQTNFAGSGVWVGIEYDEPIGRNDGSYAFFLLRTRIVDVMVSYLGFKESGILRAVPIMGFSYDRIK